MAVAMEQSTWNIRLRLLWLQRPCTDTVMPHFMPMLLYQIITQVLDHTINKVRQKQTHKGENVTAALSCVLSTCSLATLLTNHFQLLIIHDMASILYHSYLKRPHTTCMLVKVAMLKLLYFCDPAFPSYPFKKNCFFYCQTQDILLSYLLNPNQKSKFIYTKFFDLDIDL